jgi:SAM-dependent methyltransferase
MAACAGRWNHNLHYHPVLLGAVPDGCQRALDIGCGEGTLARELRRFVPHVAAIDVDEPSIALARRLDAGSDIQYLIGDFLAFPFEPASFDFVVSVAALHQMNAVAALRRMHELVRPGGKLAVLGLARSRYPADLPRNVAATLVSRAHRATKNHWESSAPTVWPPLETYGEIRCLAERTLPQVRCRRHLLWRYSLTLTKSTP